MKKWGVWLAAAFFIACGANASSDAGRPALGSTLDRNSVLALVRGLDQVGRVDRIDAKLMSYSEYVAGAGPVGTHEGDPRSTPTTGFGMSDRDVWVVAVSGQVWPNGRVPVFFGVASPASATPYPPYRWAMFLVDSRSGGLIVVGDAGIDASWPTSFDRLPSHPVQRM